MSEQLSPGTADENSENRHGLTDSSDGKMEGTKEVREIREVREIKEVVTSGLALTLKSQDVEIPVSLVARCATEDQGGQDTLRAYEVTPTVSASDDDATGHLWKVVAYAVLALLGTILVVTAVLLLILAGTYATQESQDWRVVGGAVFISAVAIACIALEVYLARIVHSEGRMNPESYRKNVFGILKFFTPALTSASLLAFMLYMIFGRSTQL